MEIFLIVCETFAGRLDDPDLFSTLSMNSPLYTRSRDAPRCCHREKVVEGQV